MSRMDSIEEHLTHLALKYRRVDAERIHLGFSGPNRTWEVMLLEYGPWFTCSTVNLIQVPERRLLEVLRLINHINATRLVLGSFWIRPADQQLCFDLSVPWGDGLTTEQLDLALRATGAIDHFHPAFMRVIWGAEAAEEALASLTANPPEQSDDGLDLAV